MTWGVSVTIREQIARNGGRQLSSIRQKLRINFVLRDVNSVLAQPPVEVGYRCTGVIDLRCLAGGVPYPTPIACFGEPEGATWRADSSPTYAYKIDVKYIV